MNTPYFSFTILHRSSKSRARVGQIITPHGVIDTPNFVAVGTNGTIKAVDMAMLDQIGIQLLFCNTYHLMVQPGTNVIAQAGGLHNFTSRRGPIITDSGGFQLFSLAYGSVANELKSKGTKRTDGMVLRITEEGVLFRSYKDGSPLLLTPETSVQAQKELGADIIIPLDELPPYHIDPRELKKILDRTHRWEERSLRYHAQNKNNQAIYAVVHGGIDPILRAESAGFLTQLPFDGFAIGGSVGKNKEEMVTMLALVMPQLPTKQPTHLLGIGDLASLEPSIKLGIDTFDSAYPTKCARHGLVFTAQGSYRLQTSGNATRFAPLEHGCDCPTCQRYTIAYIQHLWKAHEMTAYSLLSIHNLAFMVRQMAWYRQAIVEDRL